MDLWEVDIARADPLTAQPAHMAARMEEAVADLFAMHWPYKQPKAGRGLRKSALHDCWAEAGAVFGLTAGWERGLWYAETAEERELPYSTGPQPWWPIAAREAAAMEGGAVLLDLSPFSKVDLHGSGALASLNRLTTTRLDIEVGRCVYTQILNPRGGIEMDVTIARLDRERFCLTSGAATRRRDLALLRRHLLDGTISDLTEDLCTIGVMGSAAGELLERLSPEDSWSAVPLGRVFERRLMGCDCRATRLSFVGDYGWELTLPPAGAAEVFAALRRLGAKPMGHYALDGCRIEKGFKHWGHEIGPFVTPLEAGLGFTIDWDKDFIGKPALLRQRAEGLRRRLVLLQVEGGPLLLHDEPIYQGERCVGLTTSGARGPRTRLDLAFGLISRDAGETWSQLVERDLRVRVAGRDHAAKVLRRPPYDPEGRRMRP